jgi:hypothetical protein
MFAAALVTLWTGAADDQWVLLARRVMGRIESMQQTPKPGMPIYDLVLVVLEAQAGKVDRTIVKAVQSHPENHITQRDDVALKIEVSGALRTRSEPTSTHS